MASQKGREDDIPAFRGVQQESLVSPGDENNLIVPGMCWNLGVILIIYLCNVHQSFFLSTLIYWTPIMYSVGCGSQGSYHLR